MNCLVWPLCEAVGMVAVAIGVLFQVGLVVILCLVENCCISHIGSDDFFLSAAVSVAVKIILKICCYSK